MARPLAGSVQVPGDKSLGHRALLYGALRHGVTTVRGLGAGADLAATAGALRALGVRVDTAADGPVAPDGPRARAATAVGPGEGSALLTVSGAGFEGLRAERALARLGVPVGRAPGMVWVDGPVEHLGAGRLAVEVPGDPSSASFLLGAALVVPGSDVRVEGLCLNPGRIGAFEVWKTMGAEI